MIRQAIENPYAVFVGMFLAVMFGAIAMTQIPIQLKPSIEALEIHVETTYWGASSLEVEDQITSKIEKEVSTINDLKEVSSNSQEGVSSVTLLFTDYADQNKALIDTVQAMKRVTDLPEAAQEPEIKLVRGGQGDQIMWLAVEGDANLDEKYDMIDETVQPALLRVKGVGEVVFFGGVERKIIVEPEPDKMAQHGVTLNQLAMAVAAENVNARAGYLDEGDRQFMVRTLGKYESLQDVLETVIFQGPQGTIKVSDVATVIDGRDRKVGYVHNNGKDAIVIGISRQTGANTVDTIHRVQAEVDNYNRRFADAHVGIRLDEVYSEVHYITDAIALVRDNLIGGAILAVIVLSLFLRAFRPVIIALTTIPVSLITVFIAFQFMGRTINIISLAGLAFSVGIAIDLSIVVLENIDRHMFKLGKPPRQAALDAITEIAGAVFASTATNVAVFIPVVLNKTEAGLLFKDIAIAYVCANVMALVAAYTLVPSMGSLLLRQDSLRLRIERENPGLDRLLRVWELQWLGAGFANMYQGFLNWICEKNGHRSTGGRAFFLALIVLVFLGTILILPDANYLPNGTREFVFCITKPLVGQRNEVTADILAKIEEGIAQDKRVEGDFAVSANPYFTGVGVILDRKQSNDKNLNEIQAKLGKLGFMQPGLQYFIPMRASIFNTRDKEFTLEVTGPDLRVLKKYVDQLQGQLMGTPGITMAYTQYTEGVPEMAIHLDRHRMAELGLNLTSVAAGVEMMLGGRDISKYTESGREYDLMVRAHPGTIGTREDLAGFTFTTPAGRVVRLDQLATIAEETGPSEIRHFNRQRSIQLTVNTDPTKPTQTVLDTVTSGVVDPMLKTMPPGYSIRFGEAADKLRETISSLIVQIMLAVIIVYLLLVALFRSFSYPLVILVTIPLAWSGSFLAMTIAYHVSHKVVQFDVLGMLGLIILAGVVVNNAILIVAQMINYKNEGMAWLDALHASADSRLRPIFMSVLTSVFAMLPLALGQGSGTELYRGLGVVVVGGLFVSTVFTLFVVPTIISLIINVDERAQAARVARKAR
jgi:hydrophobic/amphiphilic exporter-1 (mainly G- bacteria), HAE1 family